MDVSQPKVTPSCDDPPPSWLLVHAPYWQTAPCSGISGSFVEMWDHLCTHLTGRWSGASTRRLGPLSPCCFAGMWARGSFRVCVLVPMGVEWEQLEPCPAFRGPASPLLLCPLFNLCLPQLPHWGSEGDCGPH